MKIKVNFFCKESRRPRKEVSNFVLKSRFKKVVLFMSYFVENNGSKLSLYFSSTKYFKMWQTKKKLFSSIKLFFRSFQNSKHFFLKMKKDEQRRDSFRGQWKSLPNAKLNRSLHMPIPRLWCVPVVTTWMKSKTILPQCNMKLETVRVAT